MEATGNNAELAQSIRGGVWNTLSSGANAARDIREFLGNSGRDLATRLFSPEDQALMVLIGGLRSITGPLLGALVLIGLEEVLKAHLDNWKLAEGLIIIAIVVALPHGVRQIWPMIFWPPADRGGAPQAAAEASHV